MTESGQASARLLPARADVGRPLSWPLLAAAVSAVAVAVAEVVLWLNGAFAIAAQGPFDSGAVVRYGLPGVRALHDVAAAATVGLLLVGAFFVPAEGAGPEAARELGGRRRSFVRAAVAAGAVWAVAALGVLLLTAADITGLPPGSGRYLPALVSFTSQVEIGQMLALSFVLVLVVLNLAMLASRVATAAWAAVLALGALLPLALIGHSAGSSDHGNAVNSLAVHLLGVCAWMGGLVALVLLHRRLGDALGVVARRYSTLALWAFVAVALSGIANAALRLGEFANLAGGYGSLVLAKTVALLLLGVFGLAHRRWSLTRAGTDRRWFVRLAAVEVLVMGASFGLAVALARSVPPVPEQTVDRFVSIVGYPEPPPMNATTYFTEFYPDLLWLAVGLAMMGLYVAGVVLLARRGDRWTPLRTVPFLTGCLTLMFITSGGPGVYSMVHFSAHMLQHMMMMILVPFLWVLGAPITLALRVLRPRRDGSLGLRRVLLGVVHSRYLNFVGRPGVAAALFIVSLFGFYYTSAFELAMATHAGHVLMTVHFLGVGYLFVWSLIGIDPGPAKPPYPIRMVVLLATIAFHAFFGVAMMSQLSLIAPGYWASIGQTDTAALIEDQQTGGALAWGTGDLPSLMIGAVLFAQWFRDSQRESRRFDRRAERDGGAELAAYNAQLAELSRRDRDGQR